MRVANLKSTIKLDRIVAFMTAALRAKVTLDQVGMFIKDRIYSSTKRGNSLVTEDKLQPLSEGYIKKRRAIKRGDNKKAKKTSSKVKKALGFSITTTGPFFSPARSNLTMTGQMLEALVYRLGKKPGTVEVTVKDTGRKGEDLTNLDVAKKVASAGRPFLGLDLKGEDLIRRKVIAELRRSLKRKS